MYEFKLPDLGEGIHEGEILKWHVEAGGTVVEDAPLVDLETDKAAVTIPSPRGGRVVAVHGKPGETVHVGEVLCVIDDGAAAPEAAPNEATPAARTDSDEGAPSAAEKRAGANGRPAPQPEARVPAPAPGDRGDRPVPAAPATRKLARELGVELGQVPASGPAGRVTAEDVQRFSQQLTVDSRQSGQGQEGGLSGGRGVPPRGPGAEPAEDQEQTGAPEGAVAVGIPYLDVGPLPDFGDLGPVEKEPVRSVRRAIARTMVTSAVLVPHAAHIDEIDVTDLEEFRRRERAKREGQPGGRLTLMAFVAKAVAAGLRNARMLNASLDPVAGEIVYKRFYNVGMAVDTPRGLVVPVVRDVDRKSVLAIAAEIEGLAARARDNALPPQGYRGGTFTITNIGALGGTGMIPIIRYPECAILGMGRVAEKPVVRDGRIVIRRMLPVILSFDHRIADGADAARFVNGLARMLSDPATLLLEA